jgi:exonuclease III
MGKYMRIISWNCNGAFRRKNESLDEYNADILVIQECEKPVESTKNYKDWADYYLWKGNNKNKGLGIFFRKEFKVEALEWSDENTNYKNEILESFLPCRINDDTILIGVWTKKANSEVFGYMGQFWKYLQLHKSKLEGQKVIIVGDFNSNTRWDLWDRWWNHSDVVRELEEIGIKSLYHHMHDEVQGKESKPTFFLQRKLEKPYHIDYVFVSESLIHDKCDIKVGDRDKWLEISDHLPLLAEI